MGRDQYTEDVRFPQELSRPTIPRVRLTDLRSTLGESSRCVPEAALYDRLVALHNRHRAVGFGATPTHRISPGASSVELYLQEPSLPPTHVIAVSNSKQSRSIYYPCHDLLLASHCADLPSFPPSNPIIRDSKVVVPIIHISLPSMETFPLLINYLYSQRTDQLLSSLIPIPDASLLFADPSSSHVSRALARTYQPRELLEKAQVVHGVWSNMCKLGVGDDRLWDTIQTAWSAYVWAWAILAGQVA